MRTVLVAALASLLCSILATPLVIRSFRRQGFGQEINTGGPPTHLVKRGTPTMGGVAIIGSTLVGYFAAHLLTAFQGSRAPTVSGLLALLLMVGLGGVGFLDDFIKIRMQRSLGLRARAKFLGQLIVGLVFAILAIVYHNRLGYTPGSTHLSFLRDIPLLPLSAVGFVLVAYLIISATSNAVNLTDGLDGLASGSAAMVFGAFALITFIQSRAVCTPTYQLAGCYRVADPGDLALVAASAMAACFGFLWWNAGPARIIMGDTGSLALGGLMAGLAILSRTELLLVVLGGLFAVVTVQRIIQAGWFKVTRWRTGTGQRVFKMSPFHHHFEMSGWAENTIVVRFWIISGLAVTFGVGLFYSDFIGSG